ncbi:hypothetical protein [Fredinandcohnia sp. 179-A 10B2 NHS]|uniref:hypothetical protein n=1 Tax=Fredinandcohnia sp. 179-A 10B2 NHS TaxID=3235176 RepID=UPI0039A1D4E3
METLLTILIGLFLVLMGVIIYKKKALFLVNLVLWNGVTGDPNLLAMIFGIVFVIVGIVIILLPVILSIK